MAVTSSVTSLLTGQLRTPLTDQLGTPLTGQLGTPLTGHLRTVHARLLFAEEPLMWAGLALPPAFMQGEKVLY